MKDELGGKTMTKFAVPRAKTYSYLIDDDSEVKKAKGTKKCVIKRMLKCNDYKSFVLNNTVVLKVKLEMYVLKKSTRLYYEVLMTKDY